MQRHPPAFSIETQRQRWLQAVVALLCAMAGASLGAALAAHEPRFASALLLALPLGCIGWWQARIAPRRLHWDGQCWRLADAGRADPGESVAVAVVFDFDGWLLLRATPAGAAWWTWRPWRQRYLPLSRGQHLPLWGALRATLYSARAEPPT